MQIFYSQIIPREGKEMNYLFEGRLRYVMDKVFSEFDDGMVRGDLLHVGERTFIVVEAELECYSEEEIDLFATEFYEVFPESVKLIEKVEE